MAIGGCTASASYAICIGGSNNGSSSCKAQRGIAIGHNCQVSNGAESSIAIGYQATSQDNGAIIIGKNANSRGSGGADSENGIAIGTSATTNSGSVVIGANTSSLSDATVIGSDATGGRYGVSIGCGAKSPSDWSMAIGYQAKTQNNSNYAIAIGKGANANGESAVAIGKGASSVMTGAIQLGEGLNTVSNTLKFRDYELVGDYGYIPKYRLADPSSATTGQVLKLSNSGMEWGDVDGLPSQSGHSGEFLTTDGTTASWAEVTKPTYNATTKTIEFWE